MGKRGFYSRMARQGIQKNAKYYIPYFLTCIGASAMFYIMLYLNGNQAMQEMPGGSIVQTVLFLGALIIAIFSMLVLAYTNSFLMKRREKELGLYNVLGMEKRHIGRVMLWETIYTAILGIAGGLLAGILLSKLFLVILCRLLRFGIPFGFEVSFFAVGSTAAIFCVIFLLNLLTNLRRVGRAKPVELLRSGNVGEREPKSRWLLNILGLLTLGGGYAIAIIVESPIDALGLFFVAVLLVIIGTYCLFTSGSIAILKLLRRNKKYYYQTRHFTAVSGMLHRMKRNAAGLASICILSTMVLVTVSSTLCLYLGEEDVLDRRYPNDISLVFRDPGTEAEDNVLEDIEHIAASAGLKAQSITVEKIMELSLRLEENRLIRDEQSRNYSLDDDEVFIAYFMRDTDYNAKTGNSVHLSPGQALIQAKSFADTLPQELEVMGLALSTQPVDDFPLDGEVSAYVARMICFVVCEEDLYALSDAAAAIYDNNVSLLTMRIGFDLDAPAQTQSDLCDELYSHVGDNSDGRYSFASFYAECRADNEGEFYAMYGGFFFLGIFLGFLFLMATVLIIYYKQVSEGYEDAERFKIMQQVGMSRHEVKTSIHSQILTVFFLPLLMAGVHILFAFKMITRLLTIFSLYNVGLFALCCLGVFLVFAAIYALIYALTARAYYKIVRT